MTDLLTRPPSTETGTTPPALPPLPPNVISHRGGGERRWPRRVAGGTAVLVLIGAAGTAGGVLAERYADRAPAAGAATVTTATGVVATEGDSLAPVVAKVAPSIVTVLVDGAEGSGLGSGVVVNADGLVVTNNHVISSGGTVSVRLSDGRTVPARVVAADSTHDLALVQATGVSGLTPATFGTGDSVVVGDTVLAFGAPLGLEGTVTSGIVSALDRDAQDLNLSGLIQTDAPINSGNSGGPLVDAAGQVIAINVANASTSQGGGSIGIGFAIPINTAQSILS